MRWRQCWCQTSRTWKRPSSQQVFDPWLVPDVAVIKETIEKGTITKVKRVRGDDMLAHGVTKSGVSGEDLLTSLNLDISKFLWTGSRKTNMG